MTILKVIFSNLMKLFEKEQNIKDDYRLARTRKPSLVAIAQQFSMSSRESYLMLGTPVKASMPVMLDEVSEQNPNESQLNHSHCVDTIENLKLELLVCKEIIKKTGSNLETTNNNSYTCSDRNSSKIGAESDELLAAKIIKLFSEHFDISASNSSESKFQALSEIVEKLDANDDLNKLQTKLKNLEAMMSDLDSEFNQKLTKLYQKLLAMVEYQNKLKQKVLEYQQMISNLENDKLNWQKKQNSEIRYKNLLEKLESELKARDDEIASQLKLLTKLELQANGTEKLKQLLQLEKEYNKSLIDYNNLLNEKLTVERRNNEESQKLWQQKVLHLERKRDQLKLEFIENEKATSNRLSQFKEKLGGKLEEYRKEIEELKAENSTLMTKLQKYERSSVIKRSPLVRSSSASCVSSPSVTQQGLFKSTQIRKK